jgi:hypothetical protein
MSDRAAIAGSVREVTIHGRPFPVNARNSAQIILGGVRSNVEVFGSGEAGITQEHIAWCVAGIDLVVNEDRGDLGFLGELFNSAVGAIGGAIGGAVGGFVTGLGIKPPPEGPDRSYLADIAELGSFVPMTFELVDGAVYSGRGTIVGEIPTETMTALANLTFMGPGRLVKQ